MVCICAAVPVEVWAMDASLRMWNLCFLSLRLGATTFRGLPYGGNYGDTTDGLTGTVCVATFVPHTLPLCPKFNRLAFAIQ